MNYHSLLKDMSLKITPQRVSVLKILGMHGHPTIDELYKEIKDEFPSVSLATVYKNIHALRDSGAIMEIITPDGKTRYDIYMKPHVHIICKKCGHIEDVDFSDSMYEYQQELAASSKYDIQRLDVTATIETCKHCVIRL